MMLLQSKHRFALGAVALLALAACSQNTESADSTATLAPAGSAEADTVETPVPQPTVTPNADPIETYHPNAIQPETTLSISATGDVKRAPDLAILSAGVQTQAETAQQAMQDNAAAMQGVFTALEEAGVSKRDMQTSNFSLQPQYDYSNRQNGAPPRLTGYTASNQLTVQVRDLDSLGETMDALVAAGGNTFSGLNFALDDPTAARNEARRLAMSEAILRAELYAAASGYEVARIVTLSESGGFQGPQPVAMMARSMDMVESTPIASGEVGYAITVNVVFELRKPTE